MNLSYSLTLSRLPNDDVEVDMVEQKELRNQVLLDSEGLDIIVFTEEETTRALQEIKNRKAQTTLKLRH